jgi:PAS domain S-box-containing protein
MSAVKPATSFASQKLPPKLVDPAELLDLAYDAVFVRTFQDRRIIFWNRGAALLYGYDDPEALGQVPGELLHTIYPLPLEEIERLIAASGRWEGVLIQRTRDGRVLTVNGRWALKRDSQGNPSAILEINSDITDRYQAELRLRQAEDQILELRTREAAQLRDQARNIRELEKAKTRLLNLASHELRGPLSVLRGYISMLADGSISPERFGALAPILLAKATQMNTLVQQMLETARLEDSRMQLNRRPVDLVRLARLSVAELTPLLPEGQRIEVTAEVPAVVDVDEERVHTIITNLLDNAIKYSLGEGQISCTVELADHHARLCVRDHGPGITSENMRRLFGRFERIVTDENQHIPGTGLGLHLARELARLHGGELTASSTPGQGSEFVLTLPLANAVQT